MVERLRFVISYGGEFRGNRYINGKKKVISPHFDVDLLSYPNVMSYVKELGYTMISSLYYFNCGKKDFVAVKDDVGILNACEGKSNGDLLEFFIEHVRGTTVVSGEEQNQPFVRAVGEGSGVERHKGKAILTTQEDPYEETNVYESNHLMLEDYEYEDTTFDDILFDVPVLTDDDEELQEARKKVRESQNKRGKNKKSEEELQGQGGECWVEGRELQVCEGELLGAEIDMGNDNLVGELVSDYEVVGAVNDFPIGEYSDGNESEYFESDDMGSYCSEVDSDDESEFVRRKNPRVRFDTKAELPVFCIGMIFSSMDEARQAVKKYAIKRGLGIKLVKNDKTRLRAKCKEGCPWKILISMERNDETLTVKTYEHKHECQRVEKVRFANYKYLAVQLKDHVYNQPGITLKALTTICQKEIKLHVSFSVVAKARQIILTEMIGDYQREYALLHDYVRIIITSNPGSTCIVKSNMDEGGDRPTFTKFYVCFEACKKGWLEGCRKIVGLDGCFMKGLCKGQLLCAIGRDGNNQMFPIAWAVVQVENTTTWTWFIRCLQRDIKLGDGEGITIMSDMQKVARCCRYGWHFTYREGCA